ncbi:VanZ family protein, partial [Enterococcus faecalis]
DSIGALTAVILCVLFAAFKKRL